MIDWEIRLYIFSGIAIKLYQLWKEGKLKVPSVAKKFLAKFIY